MRKLMLLILIGYLAFFVGCASIAKKVFKPEQGLSVDAQIGDRDYGESQKAHSVSGDMSGRDTTNTDIAGAENVTLQYKVIDLASRERWYLYLLILIFMNIKPPHLLIKDLIEWYKKHQKNL